MNESFVKSLYASIVDENIKLYEDMYRLHTPVDTIDVEMRRSFFQNLTDDEKRVVLSLIQQTIVDSISNVLGVIDGSSTLVGFDEELKLYLGGVDTESELQDAFLELVEKLDE